MKISIANTVKLVTVAGILASALHGCTKYDSAFQKLEKTDPASKKNGQSSAQVKSAGDGKNDLLGYGYDVTGEYANSSASKFSVINVNALQNAQPLRVEWDLSRTQAGNLTSGENARSYLEKRSTKVKGSLDLALFKGSIETSFSSSNYLSTKFIYSSYDLIIKQKRVKLNADISLLKQYLQPTFLSDVQNRPPADIVNAYGTHVLIDIILGAKLEVMYQSESIASERSRASEIGIDVGLKKIFNLGAGLNYSYSDEEKNANFSQQLHYRTIGGDPSRSLIGQTPIGSSTPTVDIANWQSSSTVANAELIDFGDNGILPLFELIDDPIKKEAVKNYIIQYLKDRQASLIQQKIYAKITAENIVPHFYYDSYWNDVKTGDQYICFYGEDKITPAVFKGYVSFRYNIVHEDGTDIWRPGVTQTWEIQNRHKVFLSRAFISARGNRQHPWCEMMFEILPGNGFEPINQQIDPRP
ncbi:MAG TPA: MAC/perforin domain-containing protein [Chitinophaga sp.]|uniref:MAC/perforin domain-containing protein n=1 Tax=Chitinophaga sp. TaxID=1869181 RepID=UPI002C6D7A4D|nr:MAC/perforin domain-containing protein [Chitinophaga sp.]HVI49203.1 MAC/perforin domain-containing protein [Chitinophaga sp.]